MCPIKKIYIKKTTIVMKNIVRFANKQIDKFNATKVTLLGLLINIIGLLNNFNF